MTSYNELVLNMPHDEGIVCLCCIKRGTKKVYNFRYVQEQEWRKQFVDAFISLCGIRSNITMDTLYSVIKKFYDYLVSIEYSFPEQLFEIKPDVLDLYAIYLYQLNLADSTKSAYFSKLLSIFRRISSLNDDKYFNFELPNNFLVGSKSIEHAKAYDEAQINSILKALESSIETNVLFNFRQEWFDETKYLVGDFKDKKFRDCYYTQYFLKNKALVAPGLSKDQIHQRFKTRIHWDMGINKYYETMNNNLTEYANRYDGLKLVYFPLDIGNLFDLYLLAAISTGFNVQVLLEMTRDTWCVEHPFCKQTNIIQSPKHRSNKMYKSSFAKHNESLIHYLQQYIRISDLMLCNENRLNSFWLYKKRTSNSPHNFNKYDLNYINTRFVSHNSLQETIGSPRILFRRLRATVAEEMLIRFKGDFIKLQQFLNHYSSKTTYQYVENSLDNLNIQEELLECVDRMVCSFISGESSTDQSELVKHLGIDDATSIKILSGKFDTPFARCKDPYAGACRDQTKGELCKNYDLLRCLLCDRAVVFPEDLYKLFSYIEYKKYQLKRGVISSEIYAFYEPMIDFIERELASRFKTSDVNSMWTKAKEDPYYVCS